MIAVSLLALALAQSADVPACPRRGNGPWVTDRDYPREARKLHQQGTVKFELEIATNGCAARCTIIKSSGYPLLDDKTCALMLERARFNPDRDANGNPIPAIWQHDFTWKL